LIQIHSESEFGFSKILNSNLLMNLNQDLVILLESRFTCAMTLTMSANNYKWFKEDIYTAITAACKQNLF